MIVVIVRVSNKVFVLKIKNKKNKKSGEKVHFFSPSLPFISMFNFLEIFIIFSPFKFFCPQFFFISASKAF